MKPKPKSDRDQGGRFTGKTPGPGRPKGLPNKVNRIVREILKDNAEELTRALVDKAKAGDVAALKVIFSRLVPPVTREPLELPDGLKAPEDKDALLQFVQDAFQLVLDGNLAPKDAAEIVTMAEDLVKRISWRRDAIDWGLE